MSKIKIGQIGVAHGHADGWMAMYRASADYEVVGVVEPDAALRAKAQASLVYKDLRWMTRDELLAVKGLQVVAVETQIKDLLPTAEACVKAGLHVQLDKPAGTSLPHLKKILDLAASKHLAFQLGYMYRHNPAVVLLRDMLKQGWLGEPFEVHAVMSKVVEPGYRRLFAEYPGGIMFELGCHLIDLVVSLLGKPEAVTPFKQHAAAADDKLLDNMLAVLAYPKAIASVKSSAMEVEGFDRRHVALCGTEGTFHIQPLDSPAARLALSKPRGKYRRGYQDVKFDRYIRYVGNAAEMAQIIRGEKDPTFGYGHELAVQETLLKACGLSTEA